jgi:hypothetical protein
MTKIIRWFLVIPSIRPPPSSAFDEVRLKTFGSSRVPTTISNHFDGSGIWRLALFWLFRNLCGTDLFVSAKLFRIVKGKGGTLI